MSASHKLVYLWQIEKFDQCNQVDWIESSVFGDTYPLQGSKWVIKMLPNDLTIKVLLDGEHSDKIRVKYSISIVDKDTEKIYSVRADNFIEGDHETSIHSAWLIALAKSDFKASSYLFGGILSILFELELQIDSSLNEFVEKSGNNCKQMWSKSRVYGFKPIHITPYTDILIAPNIEQKSKADHRYGGNRGYKWKTNVFVDDKISPQICQILIELQFNPLSELRPTQCTNVYCTLKARNHNQNARFTCHQQSALNQGSLMFLASRIPFIGDAPYDIAFDVEPECLIITPKTSISRDCSTPREKMLWDFKDVFDSPLFEDVVTLRMGSDTMRVHKAILVARSPFFAKLFSSELHDVITGNVTVTDTDIATMRSIVTYIYTGMTDNLSIQTAENLLKAADRYGLDILKHKCEQMLCDNINMKNVGRVLQLAQAYNAPSLENNAFAFVSSKY